MHIDFHDRHVGKKVELNGKDILTLIEVDLIRKCTNEYTTRLGYLIF